MGTAFYLVFDREQPAYEELDFDGKALASASAELEEIAKEIGVPGLLTYLSVDPSEFCQTFGLEASQLGTTQPSAWFEPKLGLRTIRAILSHISTNLGEISTSAVSELQSLERVLIQADSLGAMWHLAIDI